MERTSGSGHSRRTPWLLLALTFTAGCSPLAAQPAAEQRPLYIATVGAGTPVCDAYVAPMTVTGALGVRMRPGTVINPPFELPDLGRPLRGLGEEEEDPTVLVRHPLLLEVRDFLWERDANPVNWLPQSEAPQWRGTVEQVDEARRTYFRLFARAMQTRGGFFIGHFDIDNDGADDAVFYGPTLLILSGDEKTIDLVRSERILKHPSRATARWPELRPPWSWERTLSAQDVYPVADALRSVSYGLFRFEDKVYVEFWWSQHPTDYGIVDNQRLGAVHIYLNEGDTSREVCRVQMNPELAPSRPPI